MRIRGCLTVTQTNSREQLNIGGLNMATFKPYMKSAIESKKPVYVDILSNMGNFSKYEPPRYGRSGYNKWFDSYRAPEYEKTGCSDFVVIPPEFKLDNPRIIISVSNPTYRYNKELTVYKTATVDIDGVYCYIPYDDRFLPRVLEDCIKIESHIINGFKTTHLYINGPLIIDNNLLNC